MFVEPAPSKAIGFVLLEAGSGLWPFFSFLSYASVDDDVDNDAGHGRGIHDDDNVLFYF